MPSNTLALGLYERCILKRTFRHTTGFCRFREGERRRLSIGDNFLQQLRRSGVSRVCGEKVAAARTEKLGTHSHTHSLTHSLTHTHTGRLLYPRYSPAAARVMKSTKCGPSPHSKNGLVACIVNFQTPMTSDTKKKFAAICRKVWLNCCRLRRCGSTT